MLDELRFIREKVSKKFPDHRKVMGISMQRDDEGAQWLVSPVMSPDGSNVAGPLEIPKEIVLLTLAEDGKVSMNVATEVTNLFRDASRNDLSLLDGRAIKNVAALLGFNEQPE